MLRKKLMEFYVLHLVEQKGNNPKDWVFERVSKRMYIYIDSENQYFIDTPHYHKQRKRLEHKSFNSMVQSTPIKVCRTYTDEEAEQIIAKYGGPKCKCTICVINTH